ncbi:MAG: DMT family transporter [Anaerolineaceae bacterium]|jgi:drug/metabolite transporter (DMT)-like permease
MNNNSWKKSPYLLLVIGIFAVSTAAILIKTVLPSASPISVAFHRLFFSAIIANLILFSTKREEKVHFDVRLLGLLVLSGVLLALHFALWIWSLDLVSVNSSVIFVTTSPLWVGILSPIVLKERVPRRFYIGLLFAFLGGLLIAVLGNNTEGSNTLPGLLMALLSAWMVAGYLLVGRKVASRMSTELYVSIVYSVAALVLGILLLFIEKGYPIYPPRIYLIFLLLAIVPQTLGHTSMNKALTLLPARIVSLALLFEPIGSSILAILFLKEIPSAVELAGGILILLGLFIALSAKPNAA